MTGPHLPTAVPVRKRVVKLDRPLIIPVIKLMVPGIRYIDQRIPVLIKAVGKGPVIRIDAFSDEGGSCHSSCGQGIGIPEQDIPRIFDRFYRAHNSGVNIKGTGLGLAIVKLICDKHDAEIKVTSKLGEGTTFEIIIGASY